MALRAIPWDNWSHASSLDTTHNGMRLPYRMSGGVASTWTTPLVPTLRARRRPQCWGGGGGGAGGGGGRGVQIGQ